MSSKRNSSVANLLVRFGEILLVLAVSILIFTFLPVVKEEANYRLQQIENRGQTVKITPVDTDFAIVIEKIGANAKVVANVDPFNPREYQLALSRGVAAAKGSALPGEPGNLFLFSHSSVDFFEATRYNSVFYLLDKLQPGDKVDLYYHGQKFTYILTKKLIVAANEVSYIKGWSSAKTLTLMTCWPPGTSLKRLIWLANLENPS